MKRHVCTVAVGLALALVSAGPAAASLPGLGDVQTATQSSTFGEQTVGEQKNDADVTQAQGNGNVNVSPAIAIFGDASTTNEQGSDNTAKVDVDQSNTATQTQSSEQKQSLDQSGSNGSCCEGQSQAGEQTVYGGDQTVDEQKNTADVTQYQGNGNVNVSPAIAVFGDASTENSQGNDNHAKADIDQSNDARQSQDASQSQSLDQSGGSCCDGQSQAGEQKVVFGDQTIGEQKNDADVRQYQGNGNVNVSRAIAISGDASTKNAQGNDNVAKADVDQSNSAKQTQRAEQRQSLEQDLGDCCKNGGDCCKPSHDCKQSCSPKHDPCKKERCDSGQSQAGEQKVVFGDQTVGEQKNTADVTQKQGNGNVNVSPAIALGSPKHDDCKSKCDGKKSGKHGGDASTWNSQGNGNQAYAYVDQSNRAYQSQAAKQKQSLVQACKGVI